MDTNKAQAEIQINNDGSKRTLGLIWRVKDDILTYSVNLPNNCQVTKRNILSIASMIFDPLGLLSPCTIIAKILIQTLWLEKLSWDESLPAGLHSRWTQYYNQLKSLNNFVISRQAMASNVVKVQIHGFADASKGAYRACVYIRALDNKGKVHSNLLCAKTKVAPLKTQTIPRLELCRALILARLISTIERALEIDTDSITYWSDSTIVLSWLGTQPSSLPTFESNRVARIQELSNGRIWRHVPTNQNPADLLSRGTQPQNLISSNLWWHGPEFLMNDSQVWPDQFPCEINTIPTKSALATTNLQNNVLEDLLLRYSSVAKAVRILAYCIRFIHVVKPKGNEAEASIIQQRDIATTALIKHVQNLNFDKEIIILKRGCNISKGPLASLTPFLDENGIIRVGGRLGNSEFENDKKHPNLLPGNHIFTNRLLTEEHKKLMHAGPQLLLASIRERFWPLRGRNLARKIVNSCTPCFRANPKQMQHIMGHLPSTRVRRTFPFEITGVDYGGPFQIKDRKGRGCKTSKCYLCLFVCFATKAVHLELVSDLAREAFIAALRCFVSRRGKPSQLYSDNGKNFVGGNNALKELNKFLNDETKFISESMAEQGIDWNFIPAYSPHFGGLWEAGIKSVKHHLKRVAANALLTFEEFYTLLVQIEAILNSRPLTPLSSDPNDFSCLTPAHFLIGRPFNAVSDPNVLHIKESRLPFGKDYSRSSKLVGAMEQGVHFGIAAANQVEVSISHFTTGCACSSQGRKSTAVQMETRKN